jgi:hypothetical protein
MASLRYIYCYIQLHSTPAAMTKPVYFWHLLFELYHSTSMNVNSIVAVTSHRTVPPCCAPSNILTHNTPTHLSFHVRLASHHHPTAWGWLMLSALICFIVSASPTGQSLRLQRPCCCSFDELNVHMYLLFLVVFIYSPLQVNNASYIGYDIFYWRVEWRKEDRSLNYDIRTYARSVENEE